MLYRSSRLPNGDEIYAGYKNGENKDEIINGVNVHRVFAIGGKTGTLYRFINYCMYSIASTLYVSKLKKTMSWCLFISLLLL